MSGATRPIVTVSEQLPGFGVFSGPRGMNGEGRAALGLLLDE